MIFTPKRCALTCFLKTLLWIIDQLLPQMMLWRKIFSFNLLVFSLNLVVRWTRIDLSLKCFRQLIVATFKGEYGPGIGFFENFTRSGWIFFGDFPGRASTWLLLRQVGKNVRPRSGRRSGRSDRQHFLDFFETFRFFFLIGRNHNLFFCSFDKRIVREICD